jgi:hypothetical protein
MIFEKGFNKYLKMWEALTVCLLYVGNVFIEKESLGGYLTFVIISTLVVYGSLLVKGRKING